MKKTASLLLLSALILGCFSVSAAAAGTEYTITSPYAGVDFAGWDNYKASLHSHTTYSDGTMSLAAVVEEYYAQGYDALGITDHGVTGKPWNQVPRLNPPLDIQNWFAERAVLTDKRLAEITNGTDRKGRGMLNVAAGNEQNCATLTQPHVNTFFTDWGQGYWGFENDYRTPVKMADKTGGISFFNHPWQWPWSNRDKDTLNRVHYFADILRDYPSCIGLEIAGDTKLWDELLIRLLPEGRPVYGLSNDDSHKLERIGENTEMLWMPKNTLENVRAALVNGRFFASKGAKQGYGVPVVKGVAVDDKNDQITISAEGYSKIVWIADGAEIAQGKTIALRSHADKIGCYVRAELYSEAGGVTYTQPFVLEDGKDHSVNDRPDLASRFGFYFVMALKSNKIGALIERLAAAG